MNQTEIKYLTDKRLSHAARSLYAFFLKPNFEQNKKHIDLVAVVNYLNTESKNFKTAIDYERAALLLKELEDLNLIKRDDLSSAWHGAQITLPYYVIEGNTLQMLSLPCALTGNLVLTLPMPAICAVLKILHMKKPIFLLLSPTGALILNNAIRLHGKELLRNAC